MRTRRTIAAAMSVLALTAVAACGKEAPVAADNAVKLPTYTVKTDAKVEGSKTFDEAKKRGKLVIGAKADQPYLGFENTATGAREGFDIEIAKMIAADLGFAPDKIEFKTINSANRETSLIGGQIDYYVGTYTINDTRKQKVSFAGPYYIAGQDLLVLKDKAEFTGPESVKGKKVCSATGSTSVKKIEEFDPVKPVTQYDTYAQCVDKLLTNEVDAVTTDDAILKGFAAKNAGKLKVVGKTFSKEPYGVGLAKEDTAFQTAVAAALKAHEDNGDWKKAYDATLGLSGAAAPEIPALTN
ncbi:MULTISPECIES: glutamate ABC transporter substrate-binding protein [unclassified Kitasatospora]|uniref:glutamate ABC transporter substrate-binding protein n=1 Tax=unclassified Kitasatospora TaxID=2633591 RepID=UPI00070E41FF|nr:MULTISPECIES: glutamate ABC transporter substrate-binding protein [unclassified Kitasatospora]KQV21302.1 ABC transporter substrate-binding protein [Kitasatospora sp. Root107]KRB69489.1 ABC transporter substrate-binding protein [Kitasatospora sp. Root187]